MRKLKAVVVIAALAAAAAVSASLAANGNAAPKDTEHGIQHIFVIMLENHSAAGVIGDPNAPFITALAQKYAVATNYYGVTHPSEPNYVAMISGSNWFINNDNPANRFDHTNLVDQLGAAHKTWGAYMEAMPADDKLADYWPSSGNPLYASKHNPFVLFNDIRDSASRMVNVKPYSQLADDLTNEDTTPNFVFIAPDQCNDMHGGVYTAVAGHPETPCPYGSANDDPNDAALKQKADAFVKDAVTAIWASPAWRGGTSAIFVVSDEGDYNATAANGGWASPAGCCDSPVLPAGDPEINAAWPGGVYGGGLVPAIVVTSHGKSGGYSSTTPYNHYSLLATIEQVWRLGYLGFASDRAQVKPMTEFLTK